MRLRSFLSLSLLLTPSVLATSTGCREARKDEDAPVFDAAASIGPTPAPATPSSSSSVAVAGRPPDDDRNETPGTSDGGTDAGLVRKRRLRGTAAAGSVVDVAATAVPNAESTGEKPRDNKRGAPAMADEQPYGGSAATVAPVLKKAPIPADDPWTKTPPQPPSGAP